MSRSVLLGAARTSTTTYEHDEHGRIVRAVTVHQPQFDDDDTAAALERAQEKLLAHSCGMPIDEVAATGDRDRDVEVHSALKVETAECLGCRRLAEDASGRDGGYGPGVIPYLSWRDRS